MTRSIRSLIIFLIAFQALVVAVRSQNDLQPTFEFSFSNPGARSMGLGGAFAAVADDATAAFANPAGLIQIARPEVSVEGRASYYSTPFVAGGRIFGEPSGSGLDDTRGLRRGVSSDDLYDISFLSLVYPGKRWALSLSRHRLANFETTSALQGLYSGPWPDGTPIRREFDQRKTADLEMIGHSLSGAFQIRDDFSFGLGLTYFTTELSTTSEVLTSTSPDSFFLPAPQSPDNLMYSTSLTIDETDWGLTAGFLWRFARRWRTGGFYRQGPAHECTVDLTTGPLNWWGVPSGTSAVLLVEPMTFPDVYGLGLSWRGLGERLTMSFEWDRVGYSSLVEYFNIAGFENRLEDGDELHLGAEVLFPRPKAMVAVRLGAWLEPAHRISNNQSYVTKAILPPGEAELHLAGGLGIAFWEVQLDVAVDISDTASTASVSTVYSF